MKNFMIAMIVAGLGGLGGPGPAHAQVTPEIQHFTGLVIPEFLRRVPKSHARLRGRRGENQQNE